MIDRGECAAVGTERHAVDPGLVAFQAEQLVAVCGVPEPHGLVSAGRRQGAAVGAERQVEDIAVMAVQDAARPGRGDIPQLAGASKCDEASVWPSGANARELTLGPAARSWLGA